MTQDQTVLEWLQSGKSITSWDAIQMWKHTRLGASINRLKKEGYQIEGEIEINQETKKHWKRYFLVPATALFFLLILTTSSFAQLKPAYTDQQIVNAIYKAENSKKYPYGVKSIKCSGSECRHICLNSVRNGRKRWIASGMKKDLISFIGLRYSPPTQNPNWVRLVKHFLERS